MIIPSLWNAKDLDSIDYSTEDSPTSERREEVAEYSRANVMGSEWARDEGKHAILLDLDCPHEYRPSSTHGHGHLVIDTHLEWYQYRKLLEVLMDCGVIEKGYYKHAVTREQTFLRLPHIRKGQPNPLEELLAIANGTES